jgi:hypothetical protein
MSPSAGFNNSALELLFSAKKGTDTKPITATPTAGAENTQHPYHGVNKGGIAGGTVGGCILFLIIILYVRRINRINRGISSRPVGTEAGGEEIYETEGKQTVPQLEGIPVSELDVRP